MQERIARTARKRVPPPAGFGGLRAHLIGIGGSGMSGAASLLQSLGARVSGSDLVGFDGMGELVKSGVRVMVGHGEEQLDADVRLVVISAAIPESNPELAAARRSGIRVVKYAELLGMLMAGLSGVAIAGTHGKSTTSAMCAHLLRCAGLDPSFLIGARSESLGGSSGAGKGSHFVVEACEYDRSFLHLRPRLAAVLNVEADHLDFFGNFESVVAAFSAFAAQVAPDGLVVCNAEDRWAREAAGHASAAVETFGFTPAANWQGVNLSSERGLYRLDVLYQGRPYLSTHLSIPGRYNVANALAAMALAHHAGAAPGAIAEALPLFEGVSRRLSWRGRGRGVTIVDDYAHHPTEVRASLEAVRTRYEPRRTWVVFQPHQQFRTRCFMDEFADSFGLADEIIIPDAFGAREESEEHARDSSEELALRIQDRGGRVCYLPTLAAVADHLTEHLAAGDLVVTMGAGDVWKVADELVERLCGSGGAGQADRVSDLVSPGRSGALSVPSA